MKNKIDSNISSLYKITPLQHAMVFYRQIDEQSSSYVEQVKLHIKGKIDLQKYKQALNLISQRYDTLRSAIMYQGVEVPVQVVFKKRNIEMNVKDLTANFDQDREIERIRMEDIKRNFELSRDTVLRTTVIKRKQDEYSILFSFHHVYMDGWSFNIVLGAFFGYYSMLAEGKSHQELERLVQDQRRQTNDFGTYLKWIEKQDKRQAMDYWKELLAPCDEACDLPSLGVTGEQGNATIMLSVDPVLFGRLQTLSDQMNVTMSTIVEAALGLILREYSNVDIPVFGKVVSGRGGNVSNIENMVGMFVNTIPCMADIKDSMTITSLLKAMQKQSLQSANYDYCSLADIQNQTYLKSDLIKLLYVFENYYVANKEDNNKKSGIEVEIEEVSEETNYNFTFYAAVNDTLGFKIMYNRAVYTRDELQVFLDRFIMILTAFVTEPQKEISEIDLISEEEKEYIEKNFNNTDTAYPSDKTIAALFEEQVVNYPEKVALIYENEKVTYLELNQMANRIGNKLRAMGVKSDDFVAIMADRSIETIAGILGIVKAGGAYVPIDTGYPKQRIDYILEDCRPKAILVNQMDVDTKIPVVSIVGYRENTNDGSENPVIINCPDDLIYCIYTSGTTGKPKGTLIEEKSVIRLVKNTNYLNLNQNTKILQTGSIAFDASTLEVWGALLNGGTLIMASNDAITDAVTMRKIIQKNEINTMWLTSTLFNQMITADEGMFDDLKYLLIGGEKLSEYHVRLLKKRKGMLTLINGYGPTENTTFTTTCVIPENFTKIPIGRPISNTKVYIVKNGRQCGIGIPGELCTGGVGLARGYLNQDELTKKKFIVNPFGEGRLYRTGDLARWSQDGVIEYLGRIDEQVKIRGFRIELSEIVNVLQEIEEIKEAAVIVREDAEGEKAMNAYVVADSKLNLSQVKERLRKFLPEYMIPSYMMQIKKLPMTPNGKLDKRALPEIVVKGSEKFVAPRNKEEEKIAACFKEILGVERAGVDDSFFELGGHSLRATRLVNKIDAALGVRITLKDVFANPTIEGLAKLVIAQKSRIYIPIPKAEEKEYYAMSSAQKRIFLISQMGDAALLTYNMPQVIRLYGTIDTFRLKQAFQTLINRHEILRTKFLMHGEQFCQKIAANVKADFQCIIDSDTDEQQLINQQITSFDLGTPSQVRIRLIQRKKYYLMVFDIHHIIGDGMSMSIMMKELFDIYHGTECPPLTHQYKDYSEWMLSRDLTPQKEYWMDVFRDEIPVSNIPTDFPRRQEQSFRGGSVQITTGAVLGRKIKEFIQKNSVTEYMFFLTATMILAGKYGRQEDVVIGSVISGRTHQDTDRILGMFVNTLAMRGKPEGKKKYIDFLKEIKAHCLNAYENEEYPYEELIEMLNVRRDLARNPLFDIMLAVQNHEEAKMEFDDFRADSIWHESENAKYDLAFNVEISEDDYFISLEYCSDLFRKMTVMRMLEHYLSIMGQIVTDGNMLLDEIEVITESEKNKILHEFNVNNVAYEEDKTIIDLFEDQVERIPDHPAVVFQKEMTTYSELHIKINCIAVRLRQLGVMPNDMVAVIAQRSIEMIVGLYGAMKSGGAYVPIDPTYPEERILYIIEDCNPKAVLVYGEIESSEIVKKIAERVPVISLGEKELYQTPCRKLENVSGPNDLAYCIYTSGTTGKPKGVLLEHKGVSSMKSCLKSLYEMSENDHVLQFANYTFDASVWEMSIALLTGATLYVISKDVIDDTEMFNRYMEEHKITITLLPPEYFLQTEVRTLRILTTGGSASNRSVVEKAKKYARYINAYGPTENTVLATHWEYDSKYKNLETIPIGKPISNTEIYIMCGSQLCGIGVPGELCIAGAGLARGYLNREDLTKERFIQNPFGDGRIYRSGDLARWMEDGNIEYLGRMDDQVKIRGYRIELGEIENAIRSIDGIKDTAVIAIEEENRGKAICAYIVSEQRISDDMVREAISKKLPEYMLPSYIMEIEAIPLTKSGKLDKKELPKVQVKTAGEYVAPRNESEEILCNILKDMFQLERVGIFDNFFELGGDSIKAIQVVSKIKERGMTLSVKDIMAGRVIKNIARSILRSVQKNYSQEEYRGEVMMTPIMDAFFHEWEIKEPDYFNQSIMLKSKGFDREILTHILRELVIHHDMLRAVYREDKIEILSSKESPLYKFVEIDATGLSEEQVQQKSEKVCNQIQKSMNLAEGPVVRSALITTDKEKHFFLCIHHVAVDGVSWRILIEDFMRGYAQYKNTKEIHFADKTASFAEWTRMLSKYRETKEAKLEDAYWREVMQGIKDANLQGDRTEVWKTEFKDFTLDENTTNVILTQISRKYNTEINDVLLTALMCAVNRMTAQKSVAVMLESHGREEFFQELDISRTVGWFTSAYPVILSVQETLEDTLLNIKELLRHIPNQGIGFGILYGHKKAVDISFNYLGQMDTLEESDEEEIVNSELPCGENMSSNNRLTESLVMTGSIANHKLGFHMMYNGGKYSGEYVEQFVCEYQRVLRELVEMASGSGKRIYTVSDIDTSTDVRGDLGTINRVVNDINDSKEQSIDDLLSVFD